MNFNASSYNREVVGNKRQGALTTVRLNINVTIVLNAMQWMAAIRRQYIQSRLIKSQDVPRNSTIQMVYLLHY